MGAIPYFLRLAGLFTGLLVPLLLAAGCDAADGPGSSDDPAQAPPADHPPGTVLTVNGRAVTADEVDLVAAWVELLKPEEVRTARRRQALTHTVLPRASVATIWPAERELALARARVRLAELLGEAPPADALAALDAHREAAGSLPVSAPPAPPTELEGTWGDLTLELWGSARDAPEGEWTGPLELVGRFALLRRLGPPTGMPGAGAAVRIQVVLFEYLPEPHTPDEAVDRSRLEIVDPTWRDQVPAAWVHRMRGTGT